MSRSEGLTTLRMIVFHFGDVVVAGFQPRSAGHAHVDDELPWVGAGKVRAAQEGKGHREHQHHAAQDCRRRIAWPSHRPLGKALIPVQHGLILCVEFLSKRVKKLRLRLFRRVRPRLSGE